MSTARYLPLDWTLPAITPENESFFTGGRDGRLRIQRCAHCATVQHPPSEVCRACPSMEFHYVAAAPNGTVVSYTIVHHPVHPSLRPVVPYNVVVVSLNEYPDVRIVGNVIDVEPADVEVGLPVVGVWAQVSDTVFLPQWRRAG
jgi:uncharacterized OB-fold protein